MKDHYDFSKGRKNPYVKKLKEEGYSVMINYSPNDAKADEDESVNKEQLSGGNSAFEEYRAK